MSLEEVEVALGSLRWALITPMVSAILATVLATLPAAHVHNDTVGCGCAAEAWSWTAVVIAPIRADRVVAEGLVRASAAEGGKGSSDSSIAGTSF